MNCKMMQITQYICRICESTDNDLVSLSDIIDKLKEVAASSISFDLNDDLPQFVCKKCRQDVEFCFNFRKQIEMTDTKLRETLTLLKLDPLKSENLDQLICAVEDLQERNSSDLNYNLEINKFETDEERSQHFTDDEIVAAADNLLSPNYLMDELTSKKEKAVLVPDKFYSEQHDAINTPAALHSKTELFQCFQCNIRCKSMRSMLRHYSRQHKNHRPKERSYECFVCKKPYSSENGMRVHYLSHHSEDAESNKCKICLKSFNVANLRRHISNVHDKIKRFQCSLCIKSFSQKTSLEQHLATHNEQRLHKCQQCQYAAKTKVLLKGHLIRKHEPKNPEELKKFTVLKTHQQKQNNKHNPIVTCEYCGKQMSLNTHYAHVRIHTGEKPYKCTVCPKTFTFVSSLKIHTYTHTGEKPYECKICKRKFRQIAHLNGHMQTHTGERPLQCTYCDKTYALRDMFKIHIRTHTGEKPYHCQDCTAQFNCYNSLKKHKKRYHTNVV